MKRKILLNSNYSKTSTNIDNTMGVEVKRTHSPLPYNNVIHTVNQDEVYREELDGCNDYRLIFTITSLCSNILFNAITEITYKEGSNDVIVIPTVVDGIKNDNNTKGVNVFYDDDNTKILPKNKEVLYTTQCVRDTEYSHADIGPCTYHCGWDIMNNHTLRDIDFSVVTQRNGDELPENFENDKIIGGDNEYTINDTFNTIRDYQRYGNGNMVEGININKWVNSDTVTYAENYALKPHLYQFDNTLTFVESIEQNVISESGWYGFTNPSKIDIVNYIANQKNITLNKCMNNNKACEFIDFYPDRSLYSFNPKINKHRNNRIEKNWEYCLTYPHSNYYEHEYVKGGILISNLEINLNNNNIIELNLTSVIKHNLSSSDEIYLYYDNNDGEGFVRVSKLINLKVIDELSFSVVYNDLELGVDNINELNGWVFRFVKVIGGIESEYYFRIFKKLPNFNYLKNDISEIVINDDIINQYNKFDFNNELSKCGFSQSIYGDNNSQITYTDTISTDGITDNLGRPLTELYLTIIKNNKGYESWYYDKDYDKDGVDLSHIEYSRAFGKITSGLDLSSSIGDYNVHKIHNITNYIQQEPLNIPQSGKTLNYDEVGLSITNGDFDNNSYYGDIVEFDKSTITETTLESVYHRFNTAQREFEKEGDNTFRDIIYDEIVTDDYDFTASGDANIGFKVNEYVLNEVIVDNEIMRYPSNLFPEGYYYKPHYKVMLGEFGRDIQQAYDINIKYVYNSHDITNNKITIKTPINYECELNDKIKIIEIGTNNIYEGEITSVKNALLLTIGVDDVSVIINKVISGNMIIYRRNPYIPNYATYMGDDSGRYLWREIINKSMLTPLNETYNTPFTNGALYKHENINFYLRRQDPFGVHGLQYVGGMTSNPSTLLTIKNEMEDNALYEYIIPENNVIC